MNNVNLDEKSTSEVKKIHWKLVERRNPKSCVIRASSPCSAKNDLKTFVRKNELQYRAKKRKDPLEDFENLVEKLNLNDEDLLERAERRDLPAKFQQSYRGQNDVDLRIAKKVETPSPSRIDKLSTTIPNRRSVMPNVIFDDVAYRRYDKNRQQESLEKFQNDSRSNEKKDTKSICYMWLDSYDASFKDSDESSDFSNNDKLSKDPNLVYDDLLNRRLKQSPAARVPPPPPPFGIPNTPIITHSEIDYSKAKLDLNEYRKQRYRSKESTPHLINDDLAFRNLRKDVRNNYKTDKNLCDINKFSSSWSNLDFQQLRRQLRPVNRSTSVESSFSSSSSLISSDTPSS